MRVELLIHGPLATQTGGYLYDRLLVERLRWRGHRVTVHQLPRHGNARLLLDHARPRLVGGLCARGCDLLLEDALGLLGLLRLNRRCRAQGRPKVVGIVHQLRGEQLPSGWQRLFWRLAERAFLRGLDGALCNSPYTAQGVRRLAGRQLPLLSAVPGGDRLGALELAPDIRRRAWRPGPLELVLLGNVTPNKAIAETVAALAEHGGEHWRLTVVGSLSMDRKYARHVQALATALLPAARVRFTGALDGALLRTVLAQAQLNVLPFSVESYGIGLLEGMAFGLPGIGCALGGAWQVIRHGHNGYLVTPDKAAAFAGHVARLAAERHLLAELSVKALASVRRHPGWRQSLDRAVDFLQRQTRATAPGR